MLIEWASNRNGDEIANNENTSQQTPTQGGKFWSCHICDTWEAPKHGVGVVSSIKNLQRVPVLLCDKADHLYLREIS